MLRQRVKRYDALYRAFAQRAEFDNAIYALPLFGTDPERLSVRYRGLDRDAISPAPKGTLAEIRLHELRGDTIDGTEDFLATHAQALDVFGWAEEEAPGDYEIVWARLAARDPHILDSCVSALSRPTSRAITSRRRRCHGNARRSVVAHPERAARCRLSLSRGAVGEATHRLVTRGARASARTAARRPSHAACARAPRGQCAAPADRGGARVRSCTGS